MFSPRVAPSKFESVSVHAQGEIGFVLFPFRGGWVGFFLGAAPRTAPSHTSSFAGFFLHFPFFLFKSLVLGFSSFSHYNLSRSRYANQAKIWDWLLYSKINFVPHFQSLDHLVTFQVDICHPSVIWVTSSQWKVTCCLWRVTWGTLRILSVKCTKCIYIYIYIHIINLKLKSKSLNHFKT